MDYMSSYAGIATVVASLTIAANTAQAFDAQVDVISPSKCTLAANRLHTCSYTAEVSGPIFENAVPRRTRVTVNKSGTCTTSLAVEAMLTPVGEPGIKLRYLRDGSVVLRRRDRLQIAQIAISDGSPTLTPRLVVPGTCRVSLTIEANEVDVDSAEEAQAIITAIESELAAKRTQVEWYRQLHSYSMAFDLLQTLANNFHVQLTEGVVRTLRDSWVESSASLGVLFETSCGQELNDGDTSNIMTLLANLPSLGDPASWTRPDGTPKTLADFLGEDDQEIYETVDRLAREHASDNGSDYEEAYEQAVIEAQALEYKLNLARSQLAAWL